MISGALEPFWHVLTIACETLIECRRSHPSFLRSPFGYMREVQLHAYSRLIWNQPDVRTYCEVGFNGGHGTAAMLLASPWLQAHSFELGHFPYTKPAQDSLRSYFGDRFIVHDGDSRATVPAFANAMRRTGRADVCDVILVDGNHAPSGSKLDVINFREIARCNATVLIDDLNEGPGEALYKLRKEGILEVLERHDYDLQTSPETNCVRCLKQAQHSYQTQCVDGFRCFPRWGFAIARYKGGGHCKQGVVPPMTASSANDALAAADSKLKQWLRQRQRSQRHR